MAEALPRYDIECITTPTLAISFSDDLYGTYEGARYTSDHIPGARFISSPSGGHVWIGHQEDVVSEIFVFLK